MAAASASLKMVSVVVRPVPNSDKVRRRLRCVSSGRYIRTNVNFDKLDLGHMVIEENTLYAIFDREFLVAIDISTGHKTQEVSLPGGAGVTMFERQLYAWNEYNLFLIEEGADGLQLNQVGVCPEPIHNLCIQKIAGGKITYIVETTTCKLVEITGDDIRAKGADLKDFGHYLVGVHGSHIYVYCSERKDIVDFKNNKIERRFPPFKQEKYCRFRMTHDGILYFCSWPNDKSSWHVETIDTATGNRTSVYAGQHDVYLIPCLGFHPSYESKE